MPFWMLRMKYEGTDLTRREVELLRLIARGRTQPQIAAERGVGLETVRSQLKVARARLGARTLAEAVAVAVSSDLI